jgi:hypothetical protein
MPGVGIDFRRGGNNIAAGKIIAIHRARSSSVEPFFLPFKDRGRGGERERERERERESCTVKGK